MHNTTKKDKYQKTGYPSDRMAVMVVILLMAAGGALAAIPASSALNFNVNNMHCAQSWGGSVNTEGSGYPLHDHHEEDLRGNCWGISQPPYSDLQRYAIATSDTDPKTYGELYLRADEGTTESGSVCLTHSVGGWQSYWYCSWLKEWSGTDWRHYPSQQIRPLPDANTPEGTWVYVGFSEVDYCSGEISDCHGESAYLIRYNGPSSIAGRIQDPTSDTNPNEYMGSDNLTFWKVHDPEGDDTLELGGIPILMNVGSRLTLDEYGIVIDYDQSDEGGNEWVITSEDGSDSVYVWDNLKGTWDIRHLDY